MKKIFIILGILFISLIIFISRNNINRLKDRDYVIIGLKSSPKGIFNPLILGDIYEKSVTHLIFEPLLEVSNKLEYTGVLAKSWEVSDDNKSIIFNLEKNVKWHDGRPFTANDVIFTYYFIGDPDYTGILYSKIEKIDGIKEYKKGKASSIKGIEKIDDYTVKITTKDIYAPIINNIGSISIIPKHIWKDVDINTSKNEVDLLKKPIGTGPFVMDMFIADQYVSLNKNEKYWGTAPIVKGIVLQVVNPDIVQAQLLNNEIDIINSSTIDKESMLEYENIFNVQTLDSLSFQHIGLNYNLEIFNNQKVRQALLHAINRQGIVEKILKGNGHVVNNPLPKMSWAYVNPDKIYEYNPNKAIKLLKEAGLKYENKKILYKGNPLKFQIIYPSGNKFREQAMQVIEENFRDIGIETDLIILEFATMLDKIDSGDFQMYAMGTNVGVDPSGLKDIFGENASKNLSKYVNKDLDEELEIAEKYIDPSKRKIYYKSASNILNEEVPVLFLYNSSNEILVNKKLTNIEIGYMHNYTNVNKWKFTN